MLSYVAVPRCDGLRVSLSASHVEGRGFASQPGDTKDHNKTDTNCLLLGMQAIGKEICNAA